ncbi:hypothetical protein BJX70DRAFT_358151 [Aspergillus crustosus]
MRCPVMSCPVLSCIACFHQWIPHLVKLSASPVAFLTPATLGQTNDVAGRCLPAHLRFKFLVGDPRPTAAQLTLCYISGWHRSIL